MQHGDSQRCITTVSAGPAWQGTGGMLHLKPAGPVTIRLLLQGGLTNGADAQLLHDRRPKLAS